MRCPITPRNTTPHHHTSASVVWNLPCATIRITFNATSPHLSRSFILKQKRDSSVSIKPCHWRYVHRRCCIHQLQRFRRRTGVSTLPLYALLLPMSRSRMRRLTVEALTSWLFIPTVSWAACTEVLNRFRRCVRNVWRSCWLDITLWSWRYHLSQILSLCSILWVSWSFDANNPFAWLPQGMSILPQPCQWHGDVVFHLVFPSLTLWKR